MKQAGPSGADPVSGMAGPNTACTQAPTRTSWQRCQQALRDHLWGFPDQFVAPQLGDFVYGHARTQVANGEAARMVLYHYDFVEGSDQLTLRGKYQLRKIAELLPRNFCPVIIEETPGAPALEEARRYAVLNEFGKLRFPVPAERVLAGRPIANGLAGVEARLVYQNMLRNTDSRGVGLLPPGGTAGGFSGAGGGGAGGGGGGAGGGGGGGGGGGVTSINVVETAAGAQAGR